MRKLLFLASLALLAFGCGGLGENCYGNHTCDDGFVCVWSSKTPAARCWPADDVRLDSEKVR